MIYNQIVTSTAFAILAMLIFKDEGDACTMYMIFLLFSRWAEVTNTVHTKLVDEKTTDLCSLFMAPHNSKAPLSALRIAADALTFYART